MGQSSHLLGTFVDIAVCGHVEASKYELETIERGCQVLAGEWESSEWNERDIEKELFVLSGHAQTPATRKGAQ
jgi:hypothetical protein